MESILQVPVVPISAIRNQGVHELISHAIHVAKYNEKPGRNDFCEKSDHGGAVHRCIHSVMYMIEDHAEAAGIPLRFAANKLIENDPLVTEALKLDQNEKDAIEKVIVQMEQERGLDRAAAMADMRYLFISRLCDETVVHPRESREHKRSGKIDEILTGRFTAIPVFIVIMALIFWMTFNGPGGWLQGLIESGVDALTAKVDAALSAAGVSEAVHSLVVEGIFAGVGSVLSFVPVIVILFFFLSLLEDSGYMARIAFVMDKLLRKIGLSGRSIVPMLMGFGCTVPAVMATRTLPSERDRKMTIMLTPFMSCSAKLPIYGFFIATFFPGKGGLVMVSLYFLGILVGILAALISKSFFKGEPVPFVMELPNYRMPAMRNVLRLMWDKAKDFLQRAFTVIFIGTIVIWFLRTFDFGLNMVGDPEESMLAAVAGMIAPILKPLGMGDWRISTALISGFLAKESVVSTLTVLYGDPAGLAASMSMSTAMVLLVFCLLYTPCVAAIAAVRRESGSAWAAGMVVLQCAVAWVCAFCIHLLALMFGY
jgi:ferrous iron transport protein B